MAGVVGVAAAVWGGIVSARGSARQEAAERQRLINEVFGPSGIDSDYAINVVVPPGEASSQQHTPPQSQAPPADQAPVGCREFC